MIESIPCLTILTGDHQVGSKYTPLNIIHTKNLDLIFFNQGFLFIINIASSNIHQLLHVDEVVLSDPIKDTFLLAPRKTRCKSQRHSMNIPTGSHMWRVDRNMCINTNYGRTLTVVRIEGTGRPGQRSNGISDRHPMSGQVDPVGYDYRPGHGYFVLSCSRFVVFSFWHNQGLLRTLQIRLRVHKRELCQNDFGDALEDPTEG